MSTKEFGEAVGQVLLIAGFIFLIYLRIRLSKGPPIWETLWNGYKRRRDAGLKRRD